MTTHDGGNSAATGTHDRIQPLPRDAANSGDVGPTRFASEQAHLLSLRAALERATERTGILFDDLQYRAHCLNNVAGTMEAPSIAQAAHLLEDAAFAASRTYSNSADIPLRAALDGLISLLGAMADEAPRAAVG